MVRNRQSRKFRNTNLKLIILLLVIGVLFIGLISFFLSEESNGLHSPKKVNLPMKENIITEKDEFGNLIKQEVLYPDDLSLPQLPQESNEYTFYAKRGSFPFIDGNVEEDEWDDANSYNILTYNWINEEFDEVKIYFKTHHLFGAGSCSIYESNPSYTLPCGEYLLIGIDSLNSGVINDLQLFSDEGDDGGRGSGPADWAFAPLNYEYLGCFQEDVKKINQGGYTSIYCEGKFGIIQGCPEPSCMPWDEEDCWKCANNLYPPWSGDYCYWSENPDNTTPSILSTKEGWMDGAHNFGVYCDSPRGAWGAYSYLDIMQFFGLFNEDQTQAELIIPFKGFDYYGPGSDLSDLNFSGGDEIGFWLGFEFNHNATMPLGASSNIFPIASIWEPSEWAKLVVSSIRVRRETEEIAA